MNEAESLDRRRQKVSKSGSSHLPDIRSIRNPRIFRQQTRILADESQDQKPTKTPHKNKLVLSVNVDNL
jgi:hypothetical protein